MLCRFQHPPQARQEIRDIVVDDVPYYVGINPPVSVYDPVPCRNDYAPRNLWVNVSDCGRDVRGGFSKECNVPESCIIEESRTS